MKKTVLMLTAVFMALFASAQDNSKQQEAGIVFSNLNNFGLTYKIGTEKGLWRFTALNLSGNNKKTTTDSVDIKDFNIGFGVKVGREWRAKITRTFEFRYGLDLSFSYSQTKDITEDNSVRRVYGGGTYQYDSYTPGVNCVLGFNYVFQKVIVLGFEAMPYVNFTTEITKPDEENGTSKSKVSTFSYGLNSTSLLLSISYRFGNKKPSTN
jgi:hypothetical protein